MARRSERNQEVRRTERRNLTTDCSRLPVPSPGGHVPGGIQFSTRPGWPQHTDEAETANEIVR